MAFSPSNGSSIVFKATKLYILAWDDKSGRRIEYVYARDNSLSRETIAQIVAARDLKGKSPSLSDVTARTKEILGSKQIVLMRHECSPLLVNPDPHAGASSLVHF
jgi:hypothetical protein